VTEAHMCERLPQLLRVVIW